MPPPKKKKPARKRVAKKPPPEQIRDHGDVVTAPAGMSEEQIVANITGADKVPSLQELGKAKAPPFDPHAGREMPPGREFGGEPEAMITTMVFMGIDRGGDFEDQVNELVTEAEKLGLLYIHASVGKVDLDKHLDKVESIVDETEPEPTIDTDADAELDGNEDDYGEPI